MMVVYGLKNCDTVRKALRWLDEQGLSYHFHDFRKDGLNVQVVKNWIDRCGWESVLNKRSTAWRKLSDFDKKNMDADLATRHICAQPTLAKRPVFEMENIILQGFTTDIQRKILSL